MLIGEYLQNLGAKNRLAIPKKLREYLNHNLILSRGFNNSLLLTDQERWESVLKEINSRPLLSLTTREIKRFIVGGSFQIEIDDQGRFILPEQLKKFAAIDSKVIFIGVNDWIELWDSQKWEEKLKELNTNISKLSNDIYQN